MPYVKLDIKFHGDIKKVVYVFLLGEGILELEGRIYEEMGDLLWHR